MHGQINSRQLVLQSRMKEQGVDLKSKALQKIRSIPGTYPFLNPTSNHVKCPTTQKSMDRKVQFTGPGDTQATTCILAMCITTIITSTTTTAHPGALTINCITSKWGTITKVLNTELVNTFKFRDHLCFISSQFNLIRPVT